MRTVTSFSFHMWAIVVGSLVFSERFFSGYSGFLSPQNPTFPNSNSIRNRVDEEQLCGSVLHPNHYVFIYLQLTKFTKMNVWVYYLYWSNKYPVGPDDPICRVATMKRNQTEIDDEKFPVVPDENKR